MLSLFDKIEHVEWLIKFESSMILGFISVLFVITWFMIKK